MLCFQWCLPLWCDVRTVQLELCKKYSGKQERSACGSSATTLAAADTQKGKAQRRNSRSKQSKDFAKIFFPKSRCFSLKLGLKFKSPKTEAFNFEANSVATEVLKTIFFFLILFCFPEWLQRSLQTNPKQFSSPPACLIHSLGSQMVSSQHANCKTHPLSLQGSCGPHMTDLRIKTARKKQQDQAVKMLTVCKRYRTTGYQRGLKS